MLILSFSVPTSTVYMYYHLLKFRPWAMNLSSSQRARWVYFRELQYFSKTSSTSYAVSLALLCTHVALYPGHSSKKKQPGNPLFVHVQPSPEKNGIRYNLEMVRIIVMYTVEPQPSNLQAPPSTGHYL